MVITHIQNVHFATFAWVLRTLDAEILAVLIGYV